MELARRIVFVAAAATLAVGLGGAGAALGTLPPAAADCVGPTIGPIPGEVDRGAAITIVGSGWGGSCYDTGPPPRGQGVLGEPVRDIEVTIAQGDVEVVVARGAANGDYDFAVTVVVPAELVPGEAGVWARVVGADAPGPLTVRPFVVSSAPTGPAEGAPMVVTFGPDETVAAAPSAPAVDVEAATTQTVPPVAPGSSTDTPTDRARPPLIAIALIVVAATVAAGISVARRRRAPVT